MRFTILSRFINLPFEEIDNLTGPGGPLNGFYATIDLGYCLGLYGPLTRKDLHSIRRIRNCFAHTMGYVSFDTKQVANEIKKLKYLTTLKGTIDPPIFGDPNITPGDLVARGQLWSKPRLRYVETCRFIAQHLVKLIDFKKRPTPSRIP